jgi:hypothetical protein
VQTIYQRSESDDQRSRKFIMVACEIAVTCLKQVNYVDVLNEHREGKSKGEAKVAN